MGNSKGKGMRKVTQDQADLCNKLGLVQAATNLQGFILKKPKGGQSIFQVRRKDGSDLNPDTAVE
jgi:hypothetical protein